ncbi:MAG: tetratricopeptide repeat protein [candidate division Zixibacteria bacterium]|nr:tetratricopeptide repeat protein [candidate division Zixibacteria bacterium]
MKMRTLCIASLVLLAGCGNGGDRAGELFRKGNAYYEKGQYAEAKGAYEEILALGIRNGNVYYNLGNTYFKQQQVGRAILAYERALRLMPRDPDIRANLAIAGLRTIDQIKKPEPWIGQAMLRSVTVNEATAATSAFFGVVSVLALIFFLASAPQIRKWTIRIGMVAGSLFLIGLVLTGSKIYDQASRAEAVLLIPVSEVRSGPGATYETLFTLHEGTLVHLVETRSGWIRVEIPDGENGWIEQKALETI